MTTDSPLTGPDAEKAERLLLEASGLVGRARGWVDNAQGATGHTARQIVYALSRGPADDPDLLELLRELAGESERLSGDAVRLHSRYLAAERTAKAAVDPNVVAQAIPALQAVQDAGVELHDRAVAVRRRLPRAFGDPLGLDRDWPTS